MNDPERYTIRVVCDPPTQNHMTMGHFRFTG